LTGIGSEVVQRRREYAPADIGFVTSVNVRSSLFEGPTGFESGKATTAPSAETQGL
jgi:hypothetical protein